MYFKLVSVIAIFFLLLGATSAKISDKDKASIERGLQQFANDPQKMAIILSVLDDRYDFSDESEFRKKVISAAQNAGVDINNYPNLKEGKAPVLDDLVVVEDLAVQETSAPEAIESTVNEPVIEAETENENTAPVFLIAAIVIIIIISAIIFVFRKKII
ncbi:hypothetical protein HY500_01520 [Candidatus Woesearchaeota archaeon]|nr:hypothetical protein [Candidatus Woesearchaeota archaeon]